MWNLCGRLVPKPNLPASPQAPATPDQTHKSVDWLHWTIVIMVFSITGILSMLFSRLLLGGLLHLDGSVWSGPWSYRMVYLLLIPPLYSVTLVVVGTLLGKHTYFKKRVLHLWARLLPRPLCGRGIGTESGCHRLTTER